MVAFSAISAENGYHVSNIQIIMVTIPACICGILMAVAYSWHRGLDLDKDPLFQARLKNPVQHNYIYGNSATVLDKKIAPESKRAVYIFLVALGIIVMFSLTSMMGINLLPSFDQVQVVSGGPEQITLANGVTESAKQLAKAGVVVAGVTKKVTEPITMNIVIQITMIAAAALMVIFCKAKPKLAVSGAVWQSGMVAVVAIYGIAWMANTYFDNYKPEMQAMLTNLVTAYPWTIGHCFLPRLRAYQQPRCCRSLYASAGLFSRHRRLGALGRDAFGLWLFLHPQLSIRHRHCQLRPVGNYGHR